MTSPIMKVRIPQDLLDAAKAQAQAERRNFSEWVRLLIEDRLRGCKDLRVTTMRTYDGKRPFRVLARPDAHVASQRYAGFGLAEEDGRSFVVYPGEPRWVGTGTLGQTELAFGREQERFDSLAAAAQGGGYVHEIEWLDQEPQEIDLMHALKATLDQTSVAQPEEQRIPGPQAAGSNPARRAVRGRRGPDTKEAARGEEFVGGPSGKGLASAEAAEPGASRSTPPSNPLIVRCVCGGVILQDGPRAGKCTKCAKPRRVE